MALSSKNQARRNQKDFESDTMCLPKNNYATGAGFKTRKKGGKYQLNFDIRRKKRG